MKKGLVRYMEQVVCNPHFRIVGYNKDALIVKPEEDVPISYFFYEIHEFLKSNGNYTRVDFEFNGIRSFADITDYSVSVLYERFQIEIFKKHPQATNLFFTPPTTIETIKNSYRQKRIHRLVDNVCCSIQFEGVEDYSSLVYETYPTSLQDSIQYAFRLGKYLQYLITKHNVTIDKVIDNAIYDAMTNNLSKSQRNIGVAILIQIWKYGKELSIALYT